ncbi:ATP-binding protein [Rhizobium terrae]|uniref:ATP-binding protein n=1 Tax=Rhizobium terrae TaxID=2171756 RepID=UPI0013C2A659|nr:ATP-binding protein [Rhizobium terrae]
MDKDTIKDFTASKGFRIACVSLIALLSAGLGGVVWVMRSPDNSLPALQQQFDAIRSLEAQWDTEVLSLQLGIVANYDAVANGTRNIQLSLSRLRTTIAANPAFAPLQTDLQVYLEAVDRKSWLTEQVKASYAMLRNAVSVLPDAIAETFEQPAVMQPMATTTKRMSDLITEVVAGMMSFMTSPTPLLRNSVQERIATVRDQAQFLQPELVGSIERFLAQLEVTIRERQKGNELMLALTSVPTDAAATQVQAALRAMENTYAQRYSLFWYLSVIICAMILIVFIIFMFALKLSFAKLDEDNRMLQQANEDVEERLMQSAKLSSLGQMVAGITHEINTPLAYVKAVFELIKERLLEEDKARSNVSRGDSDDGLPRGEELEMLLDDGLHGLNEIATLVRTMKNFSRMDKGIIESFSVEEGIESALLIAKPQLKYVAEVRREFDGVPAIMGSSSQLRQVFLNLIVNAAEAMAETGQRGLLTVRTRITSSDTVEIDVCDTGPGISEEQLNKIFDPFYTTKAVGKGTGMGLSICYRIIENHGGTIAVNSRPGKGAIFTITLPRQDEKHSVPISWADAEDSQQPTPAI